MKTDTSAVNIDRDVGDFHYKVDYGYDAGVGLDERVVKLYLRRETGPGLGPRISIEGVANFRKQAAAHALGEQGS